VECTAEQKPLVLLALLLERLSKSDNKNHEQSMMVIFTSSVDSTHRLARLLQLLWAAGAASAGLGGAEQSSDATTIAEFSSSTSSLSAQERAAMLQDRRIIVCSDGMSRGMDLSHVSVVFNYDVPSLAKTYVHRCGRTARAGQPGTAISLLKRGQESQFHKMRSLIVDQDDGRGVGVASLTVQKTALIKEAIPTYRKCLRVLRRVLEAEENGELGFTDVDRLHEFLLNDEDDDC
jgi:ATP-dependent RNA helicase DDX51/DBP6